MAHPSPRDFDLPRPSPRALALLSLGAAAVAGLGFFARRFVAARTGEDANPSPTATARNAEHAAPDLAIDRPHPGPDHRAPDAFRPDPTAPVPDSEREGLRPATGPAPTLVAGQSLAEQD